jgi:hypothetical protein
MQVEVKCDKLGNCPKCGKPLEHFWIGYSMTPYYITESCGFYWHCPVGGPPSNVPEQFKLFLEKAKGNLTSHR